MESYLIFSAIFIFNVVFWIDAFPEPIGLAHNSLPQSQGTVLTAAGVQLTIWWEAHHMHWSKVAFEWLCNNVVKNCS